MKNRNIEILVSFGAVLVGLAALAPNARAYDDGSDMDQHLYASLDANAPTPVIQSLVESGANVNAGGLYSRHPLQIAVGNRYSIVSREGQEAAENNWSTINFLLDHGADVNRSTSDETPPLQLAIIDCDPALTLLLVNHGGDVDLMPAPGNIQLDAVSVARDIFKSKHTRACHDTRAIVLSHSKVSLVGAIGRRAHNAEMDFVFLRLAALSNPLSLPVAAGEWAKNTGYVLYSDATDKVISARDTIAGWFRSAPAKKSGGVATAE